MISGESRASRWSTVKDNTFKLESLILKNKTDFIIGKKLNTGSSIHKLGQLYNCKIVSKTSPECTKSQVWRVIKFNRLTSYLVDSYWTELSVLYRHSCNEIIKPNHIYIDKSKIYVFMDYEVSLYEYLHVRNFKFSEIQKITLWKSLSNILMKLHESDLKMYHNHLCSRNVFVSFETPAQDKPNISVRISDFGDMEMRQYNKIFAKYEIRNSWSPPELLDNPEIAFERNSGKILFITLNNHLHRWVVSDDRYL